MSVTLAPGSTFGPYQIIGPLGRGGMASVYRAYEAALDRHVALKVLPMDSTQDEHFAERFKREAKVVARLEHPNIVPIHNYGIDAATETPWMAMRLVPGGTLSSMSRPIPRDRVIAILRGVADALDYAHGKGIVHRDIKPANILLDDAGRVYLADFGIARLTEANTALTAAGLISGTPQYMAPEQAIGQKVDHLADIYALGIVAYEMLTGHVPFAASNPISLLMKHVQEPVPPPDPSHVPEPLSGPILKALAKKPEERYASAGEFVKALEQGLTRLSTVNVHSVGTIVMGAAPPMATPPPMTPPPMPATAVTPQAPASRPKAAQPPSRGSSAPAPQLEDEYEPTLRTPPPATPPRRTPPIAARPPVSREAPLPEAPRQGERSATTWVIAGVAGAGVITVAVVAAGWLVTRSGAPPARDVNDVRPPMATLARTAPPTTMAAAPPATAAGAPVAMPSVPAVDRRPSPPPITIPPAASPRVAAAPAALPRETPPLPPATQPAAVPNTLPPAPAPAAPAATGGIRMDVRATQPTFGDTAQELQIAVSVDLKPLRRVTVRFAGETAFARSRARAPFEFSGIPAGTRQVSVRVTADRGLDPIETATEVPIGQGTTVVSLDIRLKGRGVGSADLRVE